ncbi:MAG: protease pro-enzyme activation domain-containing protein, partial [Solirubrobacteraceae bacterium]
MPGRIVRLWLVSAAAAVALCATLASSSAAAVTGTSAWRDANATSAGPFSAPRMSATFVLGFRHASALNALIAGSHRPLSASAFQSRFSPSAATVRSVTRWAKSQQLAVTNVSSNRVLVTVSGSSAQIARALNTRFGSFRSARDGNFFALTRPARVPAAFASHVTAVLGLSSLGRVRVPHPA